MNKVLRLTLFIIASSIAIAHGETLERCLSNSPQEVKLCVQKGVKNLTLDSCTKSAMSVKSNFLSENVRSFCFYEISEFPTFERCMTEAQKFISADRHDDAIFECYRQFQYRITGKQCHEIAKKFRYPNKSEYLERHCEEINKDN